MEDKDFWRLIDSVHSNSGGDMDRKCEILRERLSALGGSDLQDFIDHFDRADVAAYSWSLWGAAYVMHGGCSDDSFSDFRATLISMGQGTYQGALSDPDSLATFDLGEEDLCYEGFQYVADEVAEEKLGEVPEGKVAFPEHPTGEEWAEEELAQLYPKLWASDSAVPPRADGRPAKKPWWKLWKR